MSEDGSNRSRRRILRTAGAVSLFGLAGCVGDSPNFGNTDFESFKTKPPKYQGDAFEFEDLDEPVPDGLRRCRSIDGLRRDPNDLTSKEEAGYIEAPAPDRAYKLCANCTYYCPPQSADRTGACTEVEGRVASQHWCALWAPSEDTPQNPNPAGPLE